MNNREMNLRAWHREKKEMIWGSLLFWFTAISKMGNGREVFNSCDWMQFTGLHDKHGKKVYEGDIVRVGKMLRKVIFVDAKFQLTGIDNAHNALYDLQPSDELEIIGNLYENPELLN